MIRGPVDPMYVGCHTCHAQVGQPCRWETGDGKYHRSRLSRALRGPYWVDTEHAVAHGELCVDHPPGDLQGICVLCGRKIAALRDIPKIKEE